MRFPALTREKYFSSLYDSELCQGEEESLKVLLNTADVQ